MPSDAISGSPTGRESSALGAARRGPYRVIYLIDEEDHVVEVTAVRHRGDAYHT